MIDPYKTLGVNKNSSLEEIKKSYRTLAKKYHPDINPDSKASEVKFKEISNAYDLIGTEEAKNKFDRGEVDLEQGQNRYSRNSFQDEFNHEDIFENLFGSRKRKGQDHLYKLDIEFQEAALGAEKIITLPSGKQLQVKIPAGIESGQKLKLKGLGGAGSGRASAGDAFVEVNIRPHDIFTRDNLDILAEIPISFFEAISGAEIQVPTLDGSVMLKIPAGVSTGSKFRIKNKGIAKKGNTGNQIVNLKVVMPKVLDPHLQQAILELEKQYSYNPRSI